MNPNGGNSDTQATPEAPKPAPVMDVVPPRADPYIHETTARETNMVTEAPQEPVTPAPAEALTPSEESPDNLIDEEAHHDKKHNDKPAPQPVKAPRQSANGVTVAIIATVIIVVALAMMATYAYTQTK